LKYRRDRGLCFNCDDKFSPGHRCKKLFLIEGIYEDDAENPDEKKEPNEEIEIPKISLHAISRVPTPQTMRISGIIKEAQVVLLADTGSNHNFLSTELAKQLGLEPDRYTAFEVMVATVKD
jgi:hypothetical protein